MIVRNFEHQKRQTLNKISNKIKKKTGKYDTQEFNLRQSKTIGSFLLIC